MRLITPRLSLIGTASDLHLCAEMAGEGIPRIKQQYADLRCLRLLGEILLIMLYVRGYGPL